MIQEPNSPHEVIQWILLVKARERDKRGRRLTTRGGPFLWTADHWVDLTGRARILVYIGHEQGRAPRALEKGTSQAPDNYS